MKRISEIELENIQSWDNSKIALENFNVIEGKSNSGKSAIIRGLSMVLTNDWDASWLRKGEKKCHVSISFTDGTKIVRERGSSNSVTIYDNGKIVDKWSKFNKDYPKEIVDFLSTDTSNINFQFDSHFFISLSPNKRAELLGNFSDLSQVDDMISSTQKTIRASNGIVKYLNEEKEKISYEKEELENKLKDLPTMDEVNQHKRGLFSCRDMLEKIKKIEKITELNSEINKFEALNHLETLFTETNLISKKINQIDTLNKINEQLENKKVIQEIESLLKETEQIELAVQISNLIQNIINIDGELSNLAQKLDGQSCPICGNKIII